MSLDNMLSHDLPFETVEYFLQKLTGFLNVLRLRIYWKLDDVVWTLKFQQGQILD